MKTLPRSYPSLKRALERQGLSFVDIRNAVEQRHQRSTSRQVVQQALHLYWGRKDVITRGSLTKLILQTTRELLQEPHDNGTSPALPDAAQAEQELC